MDEIKNKIDELRQKLNEHNYNYYVCNSPTISDRDFDMMMDELQKLEEKYPEFNDPNSPTQRVGNEINHFLKSNINIRCFLWVTPIQKKR